MFFNLMSTDLMCTTVASQPYHLHYNNKLKKHIRMCVIWAFHSYFCLFECGYPLICLEDTIKTNNAFTNVSLQYITWKNMWIISLHRSVLIIISMFLLKKGDWEKSNKWKYIKTKGFLLKHDFLNEIKA